MYEALIQTVCAYGGKRPIWRGDEEVAQCWADRAELVERLARDGKDTAEAVAEADRYAGR